MIILGFKRSKCARARRAGLRHQPPLLWWAEEWKMDRKSALSDHNNIASLEPQPNKGIQRIFLLFGQSSFWHDRLQRCNHTHSNSSPRLGLYCTEPNRTLQRYCTENEELKAEVVVCKSGSSRKAEAVVSYVLAPRTKSGSSRYNGLTLIHVTSSEFDWSATRWKVSAKSAGYSGLLLLARIKRKL